MNRRNLILSALLILQLVILAIVFWPRPADSGEAGPLFPDLDTEQINQITITDGTGESIELLKTTEGWVLPDADDYPSREEPVSALLAGVAALDTDRLITQTNNSQKRLKVADDDFERRIVLESTGGGEYQVFVGTSPSFGVAHVRAGGQDEVYLSSDLTAQDAGTGATSWVDRTFFKVENGQVEAFELENQAGRLEFTKQGEGWTMAGLQSDETLNESAVQSLLNRLTSVALVRPLGLEALDEYGLGSPSAVVTIHTRDEAGTKQTHSLIFGAKDVADNSYVLSASSSPYFVVVSGFTGDDLAGKTRQDLLVVPPTPAPAP